jgi:Domain of unknown function (DUF1995)
MSQLPNTLEDAIAQAQVSTQAALQAGYPRVAVELLFPELKPMPVAQQFAAAFGEYGAGLKVFFTDAGTAAWAKQNWTDVPFKLGSLDVAGTRQTTTVEEQVEADDQLYIFVAPTSVEVGPVEQICNAAGDRPCILLNPRLEDVATIGIGYAGRQLRDRFLTTIEPCYYLRPLDDTLALTRLYPNPWQVWLEREGTWQVIGEEREKPDSERISALVMQATGGQKPKSGGLLAGVGEFLKALSR